MITTIENCSRCGETHEDTFAAKIKGNPVEKDGKLYNYWTTCPQFGEPVFLRIVGESISGSMTRHTKCHTCNQLSWLDGRCIDPLCVPKPPKQTTPITKGG